MDEIYNSNEFDINSNDNTSIGFISEQDKFIAAKKILLGIAILYVITLIAYCLKPIEGDRLLDVASTTLPSLATLILAQYFRDK